MSRVKLDHCPQVLRLVGWKASFSYTENMRMTFIVVTLQVLKRQLHFPRLTYRPQQIILHARPCNKSHNTNLYVFECETK